MAKKPKTETCPNCRTLNPLAEYHYQLGLEEQRYRYPDRKRLYAGFVVVETLGYFIDRVGGYSESIDLEDFDKAFGDWLDWRLDSEDADWRAMETKQTSDHSWLTRNRTYFRKRALLACGCKVVIELARKPSADHLYIENVSQACPAHGGYPYAMDMRGRCYVCEWPITAQAKAVDTKMNKYDPTYQAIPLED